MKKQWRTPIILGIVLLLLLGIWLLSTLLPSADASITTATTTQAPLIFQAAATDVVSIAYHNAKADFTLLPQSAEGDAGVITTSWRVSEMADVPLSNTTLTSMANAMLSLSADRQIATGVTDLAPFGLAQPASQVTVTLKNGETHVISLGNELASGSSVYAVLDNSGIIFSISSTTAKFAGYSLLDLLDKTKVVGIAQADLTGLAFDRTKDSLSISSSCVYQETSIGDSTSSYFTFEINRPIMLSGNPDKLTTLATESLNIAVMEFVELNPADLSLYGLDQPLYTITLSSATHTVTLKIGKSSGDGIYVISDAVPAVFKVATGAFSVLDMPLVEMFDGQFAIQMIWLVDRITVDSPDASFVVDIAQTKDQNAKDDGVTYRLDGADAKIFSETGNSLFSALYTRLIDLRIAGLETGSPVNTHDSSITYSIKADTENNTAAHQEVIEFARRDDYTDYVFIDGVYMGYYIDRAAAFTSDKTNAEGIIVAYDKLKYAMTHAVNGVFDTQEGYPLD